MKRTVPIFIAAIVGLLMIADNFVAVQTINNSAEMLRKWVVLLSVMALPLGAANLYRVHWPRIKAQKPGWINSAILYTFMTVTIIVGITQGTGAEAYKMVFNNIMLPGTSTAYALLAFFIASAAVRAFRARSLEASLLLVTAVLVMLGNAPIGAAIYEKMPELSGWVIRIPNTAAQRGLMITSALGFIAINLRNILGLSSDWLGTKE